jgi:heme O synthase-like polyprenyltransferase
MKRPAGGMEGSPPPAARTRLLLPVNIGLAYGQARAPAVRSGSSLARCGRRARTAARVCRSAQVRGHRRLLVGCGSEHLLVSWLDNVVVAVLVVFCLFVGNGVYEQYYLLALSCS